MTLSVWLMWLALFVGGQDASTVKIGAEVKRTVGTVTKLENGDVACYVHLKDDAGKAFVELADFDICVQKPSIVGKRVRLTYKRGTVLADECQGNPDCGKTKSVALVASASVIAAAAGAETAAPRAAVAAASLCAPAESVVFSCPVGKKVVSVCASQELSPKSGWAQYRFGTPGQTPEMTLPAGLVHPSKGAYGATEAFSGGGGAWLRFRNGPAAYVVFTGIGKWGPKGQTLSKAGVVVEQNGKQAAYLACSAKETSELGPDWFGKAGIVPNPAESFDFPEGTAARGSRAIGRR